MKSARCDKSEEGFTSMVPTQGSNEESAPFQQRLAQQVVMHTDLSAELGALVAAYACYELAIFSNSFAFAAKLANGRVVTWGDADYGGNISGVHSFL